MLTLRRILFPFRSEAQALELMRSDYISLFGFKFYMHRPPNTELLGALSRLARRRDYVNSGQRAVADQHLSTVNYILAKADIMGVHIPDYFGRK